MNLSRSCLRRLAEFEDITPAGVTEIITIFFAVDVFATAFANLHCFLLFVN